jgi:hypothetical protein
MAKLTDEELQAFLERMERMERRITPMLNWWEAGRSIVGILTWIGGVMSGIAVMWIAFGDFIRSHIR